MDFEVKGIMVNLDPAQLSDEQLASLAHEVVSEVQERNWDLPAFVGGAVTSRDLEPQISDNTPEQLPKGSIKEGLLEGFEQAYDTYSSVVSTINQARTKSRGFSFKRPTLLEVVDATTVLAEVEALLGDDTLIAELEASAARPEAPEPGEVSDSQAPGFDLIIVPEDVTVADEHAVASSLQALVNPDSPEPLFLRPEACYDQRIQESTGKGYRLAFVPRHYNIARGNSKSYQTDQLESINTASKATELKTATDIEALTYISSLLQADKIDNPHRSSSAHTYYPQTYFTRFDQIPYVHDVSSIGISALGNRDKRIILGTTWFSSAARALVVPKLS